MPELRCGVFGSIFRRHQPRHPPFGCEAPAALLLVWRLAIPGYSSAREFVGWILSIAPAGWYGLAKPGRGACRELHESIHGLAAPGRAALNRKAAPPFVDRRRSLLPVIGCRLAPRRSGGKLHTWGEQWAVGVRAGGRSEERTEKSKRRKVETSKVRRKGPRVQGSEDKIQSQKEGFKGSRKCGIRNAE